MKRKDSEFLSNVRRFRYICSRNPNQQEMKYIIICLFILTVFTAQATSYAGDIIHIAGEEWNLLANPIEEDSALLAQVLNFLPEEREHSTSNWYGYTAHWEMREGWLYLTGIETKPYDEVYPNHSSLFLDADTLKHIFSPYYNVEQKAICARWISGKFRTGKGKMIRYSHAGFDRNLETELFMDIKNGQIVCTQLYHNYKTEGITPLTVSNELSKRFPWSRFPELRGKELAVEVQNVCIDEDGHLSDANIYALHITYTNQSFKDPNHPLVKAFIETMKSVYPWQVLYIYGKRTIEFNDSLIKLSEDIDIQFN